jgi:hypothetical protein
VAGLDQGKDFPDADTVPLGKIGRCLGAVWLGLLASGGSWCCGQQKNPLMRAHVAPHEGIMTSEK